jgi:hypothetical protein
MAGPHRPDAHASPGQPPPGQHRGRVVAFDDQHLVPLAEREAVRDQVQPVGGAVAEDDLVGVASDQAGQQPSEPFRDLAEVVVPDPVGRRLERGRMPRRLERRAGQRPLVCRVEPCPAVEGPELPGRGQDRIHAGQPPRPRIRETSADRRGPGHPGPGPGPAA